METSIKNIGIKSAWLLLILGFALIAAGCESTSPSEVRIGPSEEALETEETAGTLEAPEYLGPSEEQLAREKIFPISTANPYVFEAPGLGRLVTVGTNTVVRPAKMPYWVEEEWVKNPPIATAAFERQDGKMYKVFVLERREGEPLMEWSKRSSMGDAFLPEQTVNTRNGKTGYAYTTNDLGLVADIHIMVLSDRYVYRFNADTESEERPRRIPADFLNFIQEVEVQ